MNWHLVSAIALFVTLSAVTVRLFGSLLTPVYVTFAIEFFLRTLVGYVAYYYVFPSQLSDPDYLDSALAYSMLYAGCYYAAAILGSRPLERLLRAIARPSISASDDRAASLGRAGALIILGLGIGSFLALAIAGGGGTMWLTDTRSAYQFHREGVGLFWSAFASSVPLSLLVLLHLTRNPLRSRHWPIVLAYVAVGYFSGSKQTILAIVLSVLYYRHVFVKPIATAKLLAIFSVLGVGFFVTAVLQGSFESLFESFSYVNYMNMSARYLEHAGELTHVQGEALSSYFWSFVPRALAPDKPFEYGVVLINSHLYPGAAEHGYTPAYLEWTLFHLDLGWPGVALVGALKGLFVGSCLRAFDARRDNLFLFLLVCHLGFMTFNVPGVYEFAVILSLGVASLLKASTAVRVTLGETGRL